MAGDDQPAVQIYTWEAYRAPPVSAYNAVPEAMEDGREMAFLDMVVRQLLIWPSERRSRIIGYLSARFIQPGPNDADALARP
jgi:hypothetical protein